MIYGIGTDICAVERLHQVLQKHPLRFPQRLLGPSEAATFAQRSAQHPSLGLRYLALRFSAKEAFSKAIGLGIQSPMRWVDCEILNRPSGAPHLVLHHALAAWCAAKNLRFHVSLSDERETVCSFVIAESLASPPAPNQAAKQP